MMVRLQRWGLALLLLGVGLMTAVGQSIPRETRLKILEAVVQIIPYDDAQQDLAPFSGSGTIISPDGYILTNFHVVGDLEARTHHQFHAIFMTDPAFTDQPPQFKYWARYIAGDPTLDLAVLKIVEFPDETPIPDTLTFPSVPVGDSGTLLPGDDITIVGYPGISGATITFTAGIMSGWLGEDFESGGKQWVKTDAKIAHGNSGGAAFNQRGELIGVPTAGRTVQYEELDVEEQAYIRPVGLAWALIGPNVANVTRAAGNTQTARPPSTTPPTARPDNTPLGTTPGDPSGEYGSVAIGRSVEGRLASVPEDASLVFHTYTVEIPAGTTSLTIKVDGLGRDVDLAVKLGNPIENYDEVDYLDVSEEPNPSYTVDNPAAGILYVDVLNLLNQPANYRLSVTAETASNPLAPTTPQNPLAPTTPSTPEPLIAPTSNSGTIGDLIIGQTAQGNLTGISQGASFHTFVLRVPAGTPRLVIRMTADQDLDLAVKFGSEISSYADSADGGDWDYRDNSLGTSAEFTIDSPQAGSWYIDVFNGLGPDVTSSYTLTVQ